MHKNIVGLCEGRHEMPSEVEGYIFPSTINPLDVRGLEAHAFIYLKQAGADGGHVILYATGLTVALLAALNACQRLNATVTVMHYDRESGNYYPQEIF